MIVPVTDFCIGIANAPNVKEMMLMPIISPAKTQIWALVRCHEVLHTSEIENLGPIRL